MIKNNKIKLILASVALLIPMLVGLIFWKELPESLVVHWDSHGNADSSAGRLFAVIGVPLIMLAFFWLGVIVTAKDPKNKNQNNKVFSMIFWILPIFSWLISGIIYAAAMGCEIKPSVILSLVIGIMFVCIGNYMPKCKQNHTIGIRIKWTLANEENWNATHRFTGKLWVLGGLVIMLFAFLPETVMIIALMVMIAVLTVPSVIYSYHYHKKQVKNGTACEPKPKSRYHKKMTVAMFIALPIILVLVLILMFTGDIAVNCEENAFEIKADYYTDISVEYSSVDNIEYRDSFNPGVREYGFGSARLLMGTFKNDEFGRYTLYAYSDAEASIIIKSDKKILVIALHSTEQTKKLYNELTEKIIE